MGQAITTMVEVRNLLERQLEADSCLPDGSINLAHEHKSVLLTASRLPLEEMASHRRIFRDHFELRLVNYRGLSILCAHHPRVLQEVEALLAGDAGNWVGDYSKLRKLNDFLTPYALQNSGTALYFTPGKALIAGEQPPRPQVVGLKTRWLTAQQIQEFKGDKRFTNALGFSEIRPDVQVILAEVGGKPVAMAGASQDSSLTRQIGIDVLPGHRVHGIATYLVNVLAQAILKDGYLPFYGTSPSHIQSQLVAAHAGFEPAWWEFVSSSLLDVDMG